MRLPPSAQILPGIYRSSIDRTRYHFFHRPKITSAEGRQARAQHSCMRPMRIGRLAQIYSQRRFAPSDRRECERGRRFVERIFAPVTGLGSIVPDGGFARIPSFEYRRPGGIDGSRSLSASIDSVVSHRDSRARHNRYFSALSSKQWLSAWNTRRCVPARPITPARLFPAAAFPARHTMTSLRLSPYFDTIFDTAAPSFHSSPSFIPTSA